MKTMLKLDLIKINAVLDEATCQWVVPTDSIGADSV
jgi:hypothetical protein